MALMKRKWWLPTLANCHIDPVGSNNYVYSVSATVNEPQPVTMPTQTTDPSSFIQLLTTANTQNKMLFKLHPQSSVNLHMSLTAIAVVPTYIGFKTTLLLLTSNWCLCVAGLQTRWYRRSHYNTDAATTIQPLILQRRHDNTATGTKTKTQFHQT